MKINSNLGCKPFQMENDCKCNGEYCKTQGSTSPRDSNGVLTSWQELSVHTYIKILIIGGLFTYLFYNEIETIVGKWLTDSSWSHGFLIPLFSLYFIDQAKNEILNLRTKPNYIGLFFMICGILFYPLNIVHFQYGYFRPLGMIATLGAIVLFLGGWRLIRYTWLPIAFLVFAVPLPTRYYVMLTMPMQKLAADVTGVLLNLVSEMEATVTGVVIDVVYKGQRLEPPLNVAEACSGMRLLMAFLALGVAMAYLHYRPVWQRLVLLASTIPIAIFCNIVRVTATGFIYILIHPKYAQGIYHDLLGMAMLPLAFGLYGILAWFISSLFIEENEVIAEDIIIRRQK
ncbi:MAG: exosortase/archaeosortase family protein [Sedimentisphaerales bacterium]|nr:exosortase/archaeosortase family protein [Sedimentisphaerales bacterium]